MTSATDRRGVTLIELTLVGLLLGLLLITAWPAVRGAARRTMLASDAERQALDARLARERAFLPTETNP